MNKRTALSLAVAMTTGAMAQEASTFKVYGFMDINAQKDDYKENNFLASQGFLNSNTQMYVNHVNTYFDWKSNEKVRVLAEISFNRDPSQSLVAGTRLSPDSSAIFNSLNAQVGTATRAQTLAFLKSTPLAAYGDAVLTRMADSIATDTLGKSASQIAAQIRANSIQGTPTSSSKSDGISIPRVHADLLLSDIFSLRIGKWITPSGIWNVDHGSPIILTISQPNQTAYFPIFPESQTGLQAFGRSNVGDHDVSYNAWISTGRGTDVLGEDDYAQMPKTLADWAFGTHLQGDLSIGDVSLRLGTTLHSGTLRGTSAWTDIKITGYDLTTGLPTTGGLQTAINTIHSDYYMREWVYGLDTKLKCKGLIFQGEWNHRMIQNIQTADAQTDFNAYYALVGYEVPLGTQFSVTPYAMHERIEWENPANNPALGLTSFPMNGWTVNMIGLNFGLWGNVHIKTEWSHNLIDAVHNSDPASKYYNAMNSDDLTCDRYGAQLSVSF